MKFRKVYLIIIVLILSGFRAEAARPKQIANFQESLNWSGYAANSGKFSAVQASWVIPKIKNSATIKTDAAWIGIGGIKSDDLIQTGTQEIAGMSGQVEYQAWYEMLPDYSIPIALPIRPGDSVSAAITKLNGNQWKIELKNNTLRKIFSKVVGYHSSLSSAEWVEEMPSSNFGTLPLDNFGTVRFSNAYAVKDGKRVDISGSGAVPLAMLKPSGKLLAAPTALSQGGSGFAVIRKALNMLFRQ